jgi:hypothetical protein
VKYAACTSLEVYAVAITLPEGIHEQTAGNTFHQAKTKEAINLLYLQRGVCVSAGFFFIHLNIIIPISTKFGMIVEDLPGEVSDAWRHSQNLLAYCSRTVRPWVLRFSCS